MNNAAKITEGNRKNKVGTAFSINDEGEVEYELAVKKCYEMGGNVTTNCINNQENTVKDLTPKLQGQQCCLSKDVTGIAKTLPVVKESRLSEKPENNLTMRNEVLNDNQLRKRIS